MSAESELEERLAEIEAREREVAKREKAVAAKCLRHNLYERMDLSLGTVNAIIIVCAVSIAALVAVGMVLGKG